MKRLSIEETAQLAAMQPLAVGTGLTERERHARELAAKALSLGVTSRATAGDGLLDELCEWLRTEPALNEEVVQAALPKLRAEQVPLRWWVGWQGCVLWANSGSSGIQCCRGYAITLVTTRLPGLLGARPVRVARRGRSGRCLRRTRHLAESHSRPGRLRRRCRRSPRRCRCAQCRRYYRRCRHLD